MHYLRVLRALRGKEGKGFGECSFKKYGEAEPRRANVNDGIGFVPQGNRVPENR